METEAMYDELSGNYLSPGRNSTTTFFRNIQHKPINNFLREVFKKTGWYYGDSKLHIVGAGPEGNFEEFISIHRLVGPLLDEVDTRSVTYLDASAVMLAVCQEHISNRYSRLRQGMFLKARAEELSSVVEENSQHIVLGALCDHFDQDEFFREAWKVLKPGGALITTFPADGINRVVREQLYGISSAHTRFVLKGEPVLIPSQLMTTARLSRLYNATTFADVQTKEVKTGVHAPSQTVLEAAKLLAEPVEEIPILIAGLGFKPA